MERSMLDVNLESQKEETAEESFQYPEMEVLLEGL